MGEETFYNLIYDINTLSQTLLSDIGTVIGILNDIVISGPPSTVFTATISEDNTLIGQNTLGWAGGGAIGLNPDNANQTIYLNDQNVSINIAVLIHEIFHIFGVGSSDYWWAHAWQAGDDPLFFYYDGPQGVLRYKQLLNANGYGTTYTSAMENRLPIEDDGGWGTKYSHMEESTYPTTETISYKNIIYPMAPYEIMTGWLNAYNYTTIMSMGILEDMGFTIDFSSSHIWTGSMYIYPKGSDPPVIAQNIIESSNNAPDATSLNITVIDISINFDFNPFVNDIETSDNLRIFIDTSPNHGSLYDPSNVNSLGQEYNITSGIFPYELSNGTITYVPNLNYLGSDIFYYHAVDPQEASSSIVPVNITIISNNYFLENWNGQYNLGITNTTPIDGVFNTNNGQYTITSSNSNNNLEFNTTSDENAGSGINNDDYSTDILLYINILELSNGCIQVSSINNNSVSNIWNIEFPIYNILNYQILSDVNLNTKIKLDNIRGGSDESFYYEIFSNNTWTTFCKKIRDDGDVEYDINENIKSHILNNNGNLQLRVRVNNFQEKDYLTLGTYLITYTYGPNTEPIAYDLSISIFEDVSFVLIDLSASDLDHNINDPSFLYIIDSLTSHGYLIDPSNNDNSINSIPYQLKSKQVKYVPDTNYNGSDNFFFYVQDPIGAISASGEIIVNIIPVDDTPTGNVSISGDSIENSWLTAITSTIVDPDGLTTPDFSYQWYRGDQIIANATDVSYLLTQSDVSTTIKVSVSFTDDQGTRETMESSGTSLITNINDSPTGNVTISGDSIENSWLTAITSTIVDPDGPISDFSYQWYRGDQIIANATDVSYLLTQSDVSTNIKVSVSFTDNQGTRETMESSGTSLITNINDSPTGNVTISGDSIENSWLTAITNMIVDLDGLNDPDFSYQWIRNGDDISGATDVSYLLTQSDVSTSIKVSVSFTDDQGTRETMESSGTNLIENVNDPVEPTINESIIGTYLCRKRNQYDIIQKFRVRHRRYV
jgi:hypothetical protein